MPSSSIAGPDDGYNRSQFVQSMYAGSYTSFPTDLGYGRRYRPKPQPPAKPAKLRNLCTRSAHKSFPPLVPPKPVLFKDPVELLLQKSPGSIREVSKADEKDPEKSSATICDVLLPSVQLKVPPSAPEPIVALPYNEGAKAESHSPKLPAQGADSTAFSTSRRRSLVNEEIKKPKIKPPPPPVQAVPASSSSFQAIKRETPEKLNTDRESEKRATVDETVNGPPPKPHRFERKNISGELIPNGQNDCTVSEVEEEKVNLHNNNRNNIDNAATTNAAQSSSAGRHFIKNRKGQVSGSNRKAVVAKRPKSALEFDRLLRIKSDIQLNITKKVGQIKLKVSSASSQHEKEQSRTRRSSMFYVNPETLKNDVDDDVLAKIKFPLDEQCIYGDDWSSDEEGSSGCENGEGQADEMAAAGSQKSPDLSYSMLSEIERELRLRFQTDNNLPDVVLESKRRSLSADPLPQLAPTTSNCMGAAGTPSSTPAKVSGQPYEDSNYGAYGQANNIKLRPTIGGYETVV
ncbi:unnamed protein product [Gongylonema pulchrum]|uniref:SH2 domain-containing protein n=1 Tax=Gongylonema pulchrum TaxID=637853 RepID=A0A183CXI5_9BILA|nr:unnamed protein product [Gongylonema pulchrum]